MAMKHFRAAVSGKGEKGERVRYYIDNSETDYERYVSEYVHAHGTLPEIPVGIGGRASDAEIAANAPKPPVQDAPQGEDAQPQAGDALPAAASVGDVAVEIDHAVGEVRAAGAEVGSGIKIAGHEGAVEDDGIETEDEPDNETPTA